MRDSRTDWQLQLMKKWKFYLRERMETGESELQKVLCVKLQKFHAMKFNKKGSKIASEIANRLLFANCKANSQHWNPN